MMIATPGTSQIIIIIINYLKHTDWYRGNIQHMSVKKLINLE